MPKSRFFLRGDTLIDGTDQPPRRDWVIAAEGTRIVEVGEEGAVGIPDGSSVFDMTAMTILRGLIDCHIHLL